MHAKQNTHTQTHTNTHTYTKTGMLTHTYTTHTHLQIHFILTHTHTHTHTHTARTLTQKRSIHTYNSLQIVRCHLTYLVIWYSQAFCSAYLLRDTSHKMCELIPFIVPLSFSMSDCPSVFLSFPQSVCPFFEYCTTKMRKSF